VWPVEKQVMLSSSPCVCPLHCHKLALYQTG